MCRRATDRARAAGYTFGVCDVHLTVNSVRLEKINDCRLIRTCVGRRARSLIHTRVATHTRSACTHVVYASGAYTDRLVRTNIARLVLNTTAANTKRLQTERRKLNRERDRESERERENLYKYEK